MIIDALAAGRELVDDLVGDQVEVWDAECRLPDDVLRKLGMAGLLCAQVPTEYGGLAAGSLANGEFTAYVGSRCSSLRSVMTSQGMAAWTISRFGTAGQQAAYLASLTSGQLAAVGFSEPEAGSDLAAIRTTVTLDGDTAVLTGRKVWMTNACYADQLVVVARHGDGAAAVVVPAHTPGVEVTRIRDPLGCRAAGHANVRFDSVRLPASAVLGGAALPLGLLVTTALAYGRMSVAWGCVGILRACLRAAADHAGTRVQSGKPLAEHQLVARHLAELAVDEHVATRTAEHASRCWDESSPDAVVATVIAKYVGAQRAAQGASAAVQVLASAGAGDHGVVARAYRDAKLMEIIEGSTEICQLLIAQHVVSAVR
jgi:methoxymalonate biosynthesis protein